MTGSKHVNCYVVARRMSGGKALAMAMSAGSKLVQYKHMLGHQVEHTDIEIMTISRPEAFPEYDPYFICQTTAEFEAALDEMVDSYEEVKN